MREFIGTALIAIALTYAAGANAVPAAGVATLATPATVSKIVGEAGVWRCEGTSCTGIADVRVNLAVAACSAVANGAGRVTAFAVGDQAFGEPELRRCNRHVRAQ